MNINSSEYLILYIKNKQLAIKMQRVQILRDVQNIKKQHLEAKTGRTTPAGIDDVRVILDFSGCSSDTCDQEILITPEKQIMRPPTVCPENIKDVRKKSRRVLF